MIAKTTMQQRALLVEDGVARMGRVESIEVPSGGQVVLAPRGLHVMLIRPQPLRSGDEVELTLALDDGSTLSVVVPVRKQEPASPPSP